MLIPNSTHYHNAHTKSFNQVLDPSSFSFESSRRIGYLQRLYYEQLYTEKVKGQSFYWTLTYNDKAIPKYLGKVCFDYNHIRLVTNGKISKVLARKYGSRLRYLCSCERGDGKGVRGLGNNPHYHFIFFVQPIHDKNGNPDYSHYRLISSYEFADLINEVWQGTSRRIDWRYARFGHAQPGNNNGLITGSDAFSYCSKYVCKDLNDVSFEEHIRSYYEREFRLASDSFKLFHYYKYLLQTDDEINDKYDFFNHMHLKEFNYWRKTTHCPYTDYRTFVSASSFSTVPYSSFVKWYKNGFYDDFISDKINEFRRLRSGKVRCSKSLGVYGLQFIKSNPDYSLSLPLSTPHGYKSYPPCLYYVRKMFYNTKICPQTGSVLYYLNDAGINHKVDRFEFDIDNRVSKLLLDYSNFRMSFKDSSSLSDDIDLTPDLAFRYVVYDVVYRYRGISDIFDLKVDDRLRLDDILSDYRMFLSESCFNLDFHTDSLYDYVPSSYDEFSCKTDDLPFFKPFLSLFSYIDSFLEYMRYFVDSARKESYKAARSHQQRINSYNFNLK